MKEVANLVAHKLTVVQMEFSHNDEYLLTVSRDRNFCIFQIQEINESDSIRVTAKLVYVGNKAHERIIWTGGWSMDDKYIATGSRDKLVCPN
jgi:elongator complex protein 2